MGQQTKYDFTCNCHQTLLNILIDPLLFIQYKQNVTAEHRINNQILATHGERSTGKTLKHEARGMAQLIVKQIAILCIIRQIDYLLENSRTPSV